MNANPCFKARAALSFVLSMFSIAAAHATYVPDTSLGIGGAFDISLRGDALIAPAALNQNVAGNGFVTIGRSETGVVICAFDTSANLQAGFGNSGCDHEALGPNELPYQLLTGKTGYWLLVADATNAKRLTLVRLTADGRPDASYGTGGRRTFELGCDPVDTASRCPLLGGVGTQQLTNTRAFIAETGDSTLWLMATRKSASNADEGVVYRIDRGSTFAVRANALDALPGDWTFQSGVTMPVGVVAFSDGALLEHRTNNGYVLIHIASTGVIDRAFGGRGYATTGGDAALPAETYALPVVAADNTFLWGIPGNDPRSRNRYDAQGNTIGTIPMPAIVYQIAIAPTTPSTFTTASTPLWIWDGAKIGRWINGAWDASAFAGQNPYQPASAQTQFMLTRDETTLAMTDSLTYRGGSTAARLMTLDTRSAPQPRLAGPVVAPNSQLAPNSFRSGADIDSMFRTGRQADGTLVWQEVTLDRNTSTPVVAAGVVAGAVAGAVAGQTTGTPELLGAPAANGDRWVVRSAQPDPRVPVEYYVDLTRNGSTTATPTRRLDMSAIRALLPPFQPTTPWSNPRFLDVGHGSSGGGSALIVFAQGTLGAFTYKVGRIRWPAVPNAAGEYLAALQWTYDVSGNVFPRVIRDDQSRLLVIDYVSRAIARLDDQGVPDATFGVSGRVDLNGLGFANAEISTASPLVEVAADGSMWIASTVRIVHVDSRGQRTGLAVLPRPAPTLNGSASFTAMQFTLKDIAIDSNGSALVFYANAQQYRILRYTVTGDLDTAFGLRGAESMALTGTAASPLTGPFIATVANGRVAVTVDNTVVIYRLDTTRPGPSGATVSAIEFYNTTLDHYFFSADATEIAGIETGAAGPGWQRTGQSFAVYSTLADAPGDALDLCRFYGNPAPLARSPNGRTGPNSHFYTLSGSECESVNTIDKAWQYEGPRLALVPLVADGSCAPGRQPVYRVYNNGYQLTGSMWTKNDSNHRYSTSRSIISEMVAKGWRDEGAVFCVPN